MRKIFSLLIVIAIIFLVFVCGIFYQTKKDEKIVSEAVVAQAFLEDIKSNGFNIAIRGSVKSISGRTIILTENSLPVFINEDAKINILEAGSSNQKQGDISSLKIGNLITAFVAPNDSIRWDASMIYSSGVK